MKLKIIIIILICLSLCSCASLNSQPKLQSAVVNQQSVTVLVSSQGADASYVLHGKNDEIFCSSAGNDFAFTQSGSNSLSASEKGAKLGVSSGEDAGVAELGGVNAGVLLSREVMYRTCEFIGNLKAVNGLTPEIAQQLFQNSLEAVKQFSADYKSSTETKPTTETVSSAMPGQNQ